MILPKGGRTRYLFEDLNMKKHNCDQIDPFGRS